MTSELKDLLDDLSDISSHLGLFYADRFGNHVHNTFILTVFI